MTGVQIMPRHKRTSIGFSYAFCGEMRGVVASDVPGGKMVIYTEVIRLSAGYKHGSGFFAVLETKWNSITMTYLEARQIPCRVFCPHASTDD